MKDERDFLREVEPFAFDGMDGNIECPNCGVKLYVRGMPDEEYRDFEFRATDEYDCPGCGFSATITSCFKLDHKEVTYNLEDMEEEKAWE